MKAENIVQDKSMDFAIRVVKLYKWLCDEKKEFVMSKQLLRSGTSIGANLAEAQGAISRADFLAKIYVSFKECKESSFWINLLYKTDYLNDKQYNSLNDDITELEKLPTCITKSVKENF